MGKIAVTSIPRIVLAGTGSGCGKTTVTLAVLAALRDRGATLRAFKCGPDYIDPMFHTRVLGIPGRNLDSFLCPPETVKYLFARACPSHTMAVVEGVMGYYDGLAGTKLECSTHHIAQLIGAPVVLVVNVKGKSLSLAAEIKGFLSFAPNQIRGVILNGAKAHSYPMYKELVEKHTGLEVLGFLPEIPEASLESRYLGLVIATQVKDLREKVALLAQQAEKTINLDRLAAIAAEAGALEYEDLQPQRLSTTVRVAVAQDEAFCFYYKDSMDLLQSLGVRVVQFSPLWDEALPPDVHGLIIGGGYPELKGRMLSLNRSMLDSISQAINGGMPTLAECGGFMLLCKELRDKDQRYPLAGVVDSNCEMTGKLSRFGYITLTAQKDTVLCKKGESIPAHEFHYSQCDNHGDAFVAQKDNGRSWSCVHAGDSLFAGYPHMHLWGNPSFARRFVERCIRFREEAAQDEAGEGAEWYTLG